MEHAWAKHSLSPAGRGAAKGGEDHELEAKAAETSGVEAAIRRLAPNRAALTAFLQRLSPSLQLPARLALSRLLGPRGGGAAWRAAWGAEHPLLRGGAVEHSGTARPSARVRFDRLRATALRELLEHPLAERIDRAGAIELARLVEEHVLRGALQVVPGREGRGSAALDAIRDVATSRPAGRDAASAAATAGEPGAAALLGAADRRAATLWRSEDHGGDAADPEHPAVEAALARIGSGRPLPARLRRECERRLGIDLADVRIHLDPVAERATGAVRARAFTIGEDIFFAAGAFAPRDAEGKKLLLHELVHVAQARAGRVADSKAGRGVTVSRGSDALEREADVVAERAASGERAALGGFGACEAGAPAVSRGAASANRTGLFRKAVSDEQKKQWEDDWNDAAYANAQGRFKGGGRPKGTPKQRYDKLCPLYLKQGIDRPLKYVAENIVDGASFLGHRTPAHRDVKAKLKVAEDKLRERVAIEGRALPMLKSAWAFNARTTSKGGWSNHADGKAIDMDPDTNPHLTNEKQRTVMSELSGIDLTAGNAGGAKVGESFDALKAASDRFQANYDPEGMEKRLADLRTEQASQQAEIDRLTSDLAAIPSGKKAKPEQKAERKRLQSEIKKKRKPLKQTAASLAAVNGALATYNKTDAKYVKLSAQVVVREGEVDTAEDGIEAAEDALQEASIIDDKKARAAAKAAAKKTLKAAKKTLKAAKSTLKSERESLEALPNYSLRKWSETGFVTLDKAIVESMTEAGFRWGALWSEHKDIMHFDLN